MKIGISLNPYDLRSLARYGDKKFEIIKKLGFSAVDYGTANTETELYTLSYSELEKKILSEKAAANLEGIEISQVHGPWRYPPRDLTEIDRAERLEKMKKSISMTRMLGCKYWVVHPLMPYGTSDLLSGKAEETWKINLEFMPKLVEFAKTQGVTVCLENMPMHDFSISRPKEILKFVNTVNDDNFKICLDTGHIAVFPDLFIGDVVRELGNKIKVVHVHDNLGDGDKHLWPTKGRLDWFDFAKALYDIGFDGVFSLETAPSGTLDDEGFEKECAELFEIAKKIIG